MCYSRRISISVWFEQLPHFLLVMYVEIHNRIYLEHVPDHIPNSPGRNFPVLHLTILRLPTFSLHVAGICVANESPYVNGDVSIFSGFMFYCIKTCPSLLALYTWETCLGKSRKFQHQGQLETKSTGTVWRSEIICVIFGELIANEQRTIIPRTYFAAASTLDRSSPSI